MTLLAAGFQVRDAIFLHRYNEPVLLVLHESKPAWVGSLADTKDTMCLTAFSLNLAHQRHPKLWHTTDLPSDAHRLIPVPIGGALVLCQSLVLYHSQVRAHAPELLNLIIPNEPPCVDALCVSSVVYCNKAISQSLPTRGTQVSTLIAWYDETHRCSDYS